MTQEQLRQVVLLPLLPRKADVLMHLGPLGLDVSADAIGALRLGLCVLDARASALKPSPDHCSIP